MNFDHGKTICGLLQPERRGSVSQSTGAGVRVFGLRKVRFQVELLRVTDPRSNK